MNFDPAAIRAGDWLVPKPTWNLINEYRDELSSPVQVLDVYKNSEGVILFLVENISRGKRLVDSTWFTGKVEPPK